MTKSFNMKKILLNLLCIITLMLPAFTTTAQCPPPPPGEGQAPTQAQREQWMMEMRQKKHDFLIKELDLAPSQQEPFFKAYDAMEDKIMALGEQTRRTEKEVKQMEDPTDADYDRAIEELYELKGREYLAEKAGREEFSKILTKRQMFRLKGAERKFFRTLMRHHHKPR